MYMSTSVLLYGGFLLWYLGYKMSRFANIGDLDISLMDLPFAVMFVLILVEVLKEKI
jgi:hypothetical protein